MSYLHLWNMSFSLTIIFLILFQSFFLFFRYAMISVYSILSFYIFFSSDNSLNLFFALFLIILCYFLNNLLLCLKSLLCFFDNKLFHSSFIYSEKHFIIIQFFHLGWNCALCQLLYLCSNTKNEFYNDFL